MRWFVIAALTAAGLGGVAQFERRRDTMIARVTPNALPQQDHRHGIGAIEANFPAGPEHGVGSTEIDIWYPAVPLAFPVAATIDKGDIAGFVGARAGAAPAPSTRPWSVVVYVPGWGGTRRDNQLMMADLVRQGFVVIAINEIGGDADATGEAAAPFDMSSDEGFAASWRLAERRLSLMRGRISRVLDRAEAMNSGGSVSPLAGRLDMTRVGVVGFSYGGSVAADIAFSEPRIKAAVNMDGWLFGRALHEFVPIPYLVLNSAFPSLESDTRSWLAGRRRMAIPTVTDRRQQVRQSSRSDTAAFIVADTEHLDFTDLLFFQGRARFGLRPRLSSEKRLGIHTAKSVLVGAHFDAYLRGAVASLGILKRPSVPARLQTLTEWYAAVRP